MAISAFREFLPLYTNMLRVHRAGDRGARLRSWKPLRGMAVDALSPIGRERV
ncbi:MAG TPA: hypothetical protein VG498_17825 [Terriglobales bacterium]|nr:hypothetical protein [Terriglobales bacterium]